MKKNVIKYTASFLLAAVLVYFAFREVDWSAFWDGLLQTRWSWIALFCLFSVLALVLRAERWRIMLLPLDKSVRRLDIWDSSNIGNIVNVVLPGAGEITRCAYMRSPALSFDKSFGTIISERVVDVIAVVVLFAYALVVGFKRFDTLITEGILKPLSGSFGLTLWLIVGGVLVLLAGGTWAVFHWRSTSKLCDKAAGMLQGMWDGVKSIGKIKGKWLFILYTVLIWLCYIAMTWTVQKALPMLPEMNFSDAVFVSAVGNIASVIPVPGGIGAYHYLVAITLQTLYGTTWEMGLLYATLSHELHSVVLIALGIISYFAISVRRRSKGQA